MPRPMRGADLTGSTRYRTGFRGVLVLQVEVRRVAYWKGSLRPGAHRTPVHEHLWRDARTTDITTLEWIERTRRDEALKADALADLMKEVGSAQGGVSESLDGHRS